MTSVATNTDLPDALYRMTFAAGVRLHGGGFVVRHGKIAGIGQAEGEYRGTVTFDAASGIAEFKLETRVPSAFPIADGLKAGPAGSTLHFTARGHPPSPRSSYAIDIAGHRGEVTLELIDTLGSAHGDASSPGPASTHPDAFPDGIYRLASAGMGYTTHTIVVLAAGRLFGLGEMGGRYTGTYIFDPIRKLTSFAGEATLPPGVPLVVGGAAGTLGMKVPMASEAKFNAGGKIRFSFSLAGRSVDAEMSFVGPLPE